MSKFYQDPDDKMFLGVLAGIARGLGMDAFIVRVAFVASLFFSFGLTLILYFVAALIMPKKSGAEDEPEDT